MAELWRFSTPRRTFKGLSDGMQHFYENMYQSEI